MIRLTPKPLNKAIFRPYGNVIDTSGVTPKNVNQGFAQRFDDLAYVDVAPEFGSVNVALFTANPRPMPIAVKLMERHPMGSQIFVPLQDRPWLVLVCDNPLKPETYQLFAATGQQGINYARNIWHHPLLVFDEGSRFLVFDRKGSGNNLEEVQLPETLQIEVVG
ncbi:MAG: ureidoglycolate lyase [Proteobacteria bacterium]|nr:ureidoglycolate lyase [Pseudomonadota bacterium]